MRVARYQMYGVEQGIDGTHYKFEVIIPTTGFPMFKHSLRQVADKHGYKVNEISSVQEMHGTTDYFFSLVKKNGNSLIAKRIVRVSLRNAKCLPVPMIRGGE